MARRQTGETQDLNNTIFATIGQRTFSINTDGDDQAIIDGTRHSYSFSHIKDDRYSLILNGRCFKVVASLQKNGLRENNWEILISLDGRIRTVQVDDERSRRLKSIFSKSATKSSDQIVRAPMPGLITRLEVELGDEVTPGRGLLVLEAMKMENEIRSTVMGKVTKILVHNGKIVEKGESLISITSG